MLMSSIRHPLRLDTVIEVLTLADHVYSSINKASSGAAACSATTAELRHRAGWT
jgi:hypothetical protein